MTCYGDEMVLKTCMGLLCHGDAGTCCQATDYHISSGPLSCFDDVSGQQVDTIQHTVGLRKVIFSNDDVHDDDDKEEDEKEIYGNRMTIIMVIIIDKIIK